MILAVIIMTNYDLSYVHLQNLSDFFGMFGEF